MRTLTGQGPTTGNSGGMAAVLAVAPVAGMVARTAGTHNGNPGDTNGDERPIVDTNLTETPPIAIGEPAPLSLLLVGGLALVLARRRAKRRAAR